MKSEMPNDLDLPNVINSIFVSFTIDYWQANHPTKNQRIWLIYNMASADVKAILDLLMTEICGKSLKTVLGYYEPGESSTPGPSAEKSALGPTLQIMADMVRNRVVDG